MYYLYLIRCAGNRLYTGITTDPARRFREHRGEKPGGARFTGANPPESLEMVWTAPDRSAAQRVREQMEESSWLLEEDCTPRELMAVLGKAKLCLAMRLHTLIFAARMAVPSMGLVYDPKVDSYLKELDLPSAGEVERFDVDRACQVCDELMADYDRILARLKERSAALSAAARENEALLLELLRKKS